MGKAQTYVGWLLNLRVEDVHLLLQTDQQGDLAQNAPVCAASGLLGDTGEPKRIGQVFLLLATCKATTSPPAVHLCRLVLFIAFHIRIDFLITDPLSDLKISEQDAMKRTAEGLRV